MRDTRDPQQVGEAILKLHNEHSVPILLAADSVLSGLETARGHPEPATGGEPESVRSQQVSAPRKVAPIGTLASERAAQNGAQAQSAAPEAEED